VPEAMTTGLVSVADGGILMLACRVSVLFAPEAVSQSEIRFVSAPDVGTAMVALPVKITR
jgi:hypothetical protein